MTTDNFQTTLAELILTKKGARSYAKLSKDCGGVPTDRRLQSLATAQIKAFPDADTIRGLAIGLNTSVTDVILASARTLGFAVGGSDPGALTIPGAAHLPESSQQVLGEVARELLKMQQNVGAKKDFTDYQAQLRQDFAHGARLRRVPATEIEAALQGPGWYMVDAGQGDATVVDATLGWVNKEHARQLKAALRDILTQGVQLAQDDVELAADKGDSGMGPEDIEHHT